MEIESKCAYVIDAEGFCVDFVRVDFVPNYDENGPCEGTHEEVYYRKMREGESLVYEPTPTIRTHAGTPGILKFRWNGAAWEEGATPEEIAAWEAEHPVPPPDPPTVEDRVKLVEAQIGATNDRQDFVEDCIAEMAGQVYNV